MFSNALKSFSSNITSNYTLSPAPTSYSGIWKIHDAKNKSSGKAASVFVFEKKALEPQTGGSLGGRTHQASLKKAHEEVLVRLKKEASSLARLRHPCILELTEPVEETRNGGLMFATEPVTASLGGLLKEKDEQERHGGTGGRSSRYVVEESDGTKKRRELELDELEIQKGLLQVAKGLEFLHESAGLVHGNLTPDAIFVNAKSDWKISGLAFSGPPEATAQSSVAPIALWEVLNYDPRLPRSVQLDLDYASPDFVIDNNINSGADMFSLGLLIVALYNSPHRSPLETNMSMSHYKRMFSSSSSVPSSNNNFLSSGPLPREVNNGLLPRLITRRPATRMTAREFQQAQYFDNVLVSTIRFLEEMAAKSANEKSQFMRGLPRIISQFPKSVLEKKVLPGLLEEMKDRDLLALCLQNVFKIVQALPSGQRALSEKVIPRLREVFLAGLGAKGATAERDSLKEAGLMVILENMKIIAENSSGKEFKDDILPILQYALESPTHSLVDAALRTLPVVLPVLDFSTIKHDLFPTIAAVFAKTSSMGIKIRGLQALKVLCGGTSDAEIPQSDGLDGVAQREKPKASSSTALDKFTVQEKVMPLLKAIKTKEPAVMMAALDVFKHVGQIADADFVAIEVLPILWQFGLGPLLSLTQFQSFMTLIKSLSSRIEQEQTRKLQELATTDSTATARDNDMMNFGNVPGHSNHVASPTNGEEGDFEALVSGRNRGASSTHKALNDTGWGNTLTARPPNGTHSSHQQPPAQVPAFSWSTPAISSPPVQNRLGSLSSQQPSSRAITPDQPLSSFSTLNPSTGSVMSPTPSASTFSQPLQPSRPGIATSSSFQNTSVPMSNNTNSMSTGSGIDWSAASKPMTSLSSNPWGSNSNSSVPLQPQRQQQPATTSSFGIPPPPTSPYSAFNIAPPAVTKSPFAGPPLQPQQRQQSFGQPQNSGTGQKQGMDKYESLL